MRRPIHRYILIKIIAFIVILSACSIESTQTEEVSYSTASETSANQEAIQQTKNVLKENLYYAETENIEGYLSTISSEAHADTRQAMEDFFKTHDVFHTLMAFEVVEEHKDKIVAKTKQKTMGEDMTGETDYR